MKSLPLLILFGFVFAAASIALAQAPPHGDAEAEVIKTFIRQTTDAFNRHDAKAWARFCTPDAQLVTVRGESMNGVAEIERGLTRIFETRGRAAKLKTLAITVRFIRPDVAVAHVTNELSGITTADGQVLPSHRELSVRVWSKEQGLWRMTTFHNTIVQERSP